MTGFFNSTPARVTFVLIITPPPRVTETASGMLNAIGLQNPGIDLFCRRDIPFLKQYDTKIIVNVCGKSTEDYCEVVERLADEPVDLLEINVSCPNVKEGGIAFGQNPHAPPASVALAISVISVTFGLSFMMIGWWCRYSFFDQYTYRNEN